MFSQGPTENTCQCEETGEVCGSDNKPYESLCHLLEATADNPDLVVKERAPCLTGIA